MFPSSPGSIVGVPAVPLLAEHVVERVPAHAAAAPHEGGGGAGGNANPFLLLLQYQYHNSQYIDNRPDMIAGNRPPVIPVMYST